MSWTDREVEKLVNESFNDGYRSAVNDISEAMYHQCFEKDNGDLQKWDSGNWFRYKLFENVMEGVKYGL